MNSEVMDIDLEVTNDESTKEKEINLTEEDLWNFVLNLKKELKREHATIDINTLVTHLSNKFKMPDNDETRKFLKYQLKQYNASGKKRAASKKIVLSFEVPVDRPNVNKRRKSFLSLTGKCRRSRTDDLVNEIEKLVEAENEVCNDGEKLTTTQLLGYLIYRLNYMNDKKTADTGMKIFNETLFEDTKGFSTNDAVAFMHDLTLSKQQMRTTKAYLKSKGMDFPSTNKLLPVRKSLRPDINVELDEDGVSVNYRELVMMTTASLLNVIEDTGVNIDKNADIKVIYKDGGDTAGSQTVWKSSSMTDASDHLFQYSIAPLVVEQGSVTLWKNPSPNSATSCRPVYLLRASEDEDRVINLVFPTTDVQRSELQESLVEIKSKSGTNYKVKHEIHDTMKDLKLKKKLSGIGGGDCILCNSRQQDWKNEEKINEGFQITRAADDTRALFDQLITEGNGYIIRSKNDYDHRQGITTEPKTTSDQRSITVLHSYINVLGWFLKVLYRCESGYQCWIEKKTVLGEPIRRSKERVQTKLRPAGLVVDQVGGANAKTGTSNDGNTGRNFFLQKNREVIADCVMEKYKRVIKELHMKISIVLRVISSCSEKVNHQKLDELNKDISLLIARELPWVEINWTLHGDLHHSAELIYFQKRL